MWLKITDRLHARLLTGDILKKVQRYKMDLVES